MDIIANQIVMESKTDAKLEGLDAKRDLVSVLVKANMSPSLPESQRLTHAEVIARKPYSMLTPRMWRVYMRRDPDLPCRRTRNDEVFSSI
jgi:hypothetical protein